MDAGRGLDHRFIVESASMIFQSPVAEVCGMDGSSKLFRGVATTRMELSLIFHDMKALADFGRIPEFTEMLGREMDRMGLCRYCGCQLANDDKPNCSQCGGPRIDRA